MPWRRADRQGIEGGRVAQTGVSVDRECPDPGPHTYRLALFRFAQDALIRFDMAFLAAALHGFRFLFVLG